MLGEWEPGTYAVESIGVVLAVSGLGYLAVGFEAPIVALAEIAFPLLLGLLVIGYGGWLRHSGMGAREMEIIAVGNALGGVTFAFFTGWVLYVATIEMQLPTGSWFILLNGIAIGVVAGGFLGTLYVTLQQRQAELRDRNRELRRQNERLDQFASIVSHDLRNPLNVAQGRLELARETTEDRHFEAMERALERMEAILSDMLAFARQGRTVESVEELKLEPVAETAWDAVDTDGVELTVADSIAFEAHRSRLCQGLENLFRNAMEHGGPDLSEVTVGSVEGDGFYVADDGRGIPEDDRDRVFDSGFTTTENGTGFGLPIVNAVVEAHGWDIGIEESEAGGARFEITGLGER